MLGSTRGPTLLLCAAAVLTHAGSAYAQSKPSEAPVPNCLDQSISGQLGEKLRPRGVQKREFLKQGELEIIVRGGLFAADLLSSSYIWGGALAFFPTEDFGIELGFDVTPLVLDLDAPVADFFGDPRFERSMGYLGMASLLWAPIHAKLKIAGGIVHSDIIFTAGAGRLFHDSVQGVTYSAGMILEMLVNDWVTLRFEVRDIIAVQEAVAETRLTNNIVSTFGVALWLPTGL